MRKWIIGLAVIMILGLSMPVFAEVGLTTNASPVTVVVNQANPTKEIIFPIRVRNILIFNYDTADGIWVNPRGGDTGDWRVDTGDRFFLGSSSVLSLTDYQTDRITIVYDAVFGSGEASPVSVIATY